MSKIRFARPAFTLVELMITIAVIAILASIVTFAAVSFQNSTRDSARDAKVRVLSSALEEYYRDNGEYPSVAKMTSSNVNLVKQTLGINDADILKLPNSTSANSIVTSGPSTTTLVYAANTTDTTKNTQCQTDVNGYCDGFTLQYVKEAGGTVTATSLNTTFQAVRDSEVCDEGDTQNGTTCTHSYAATYQAGSYTCPSGGTLSGTTCTNVYSASYSSGGGYYYCPSGGNVSGSNCVTTSSYPASSSSSHTCPNGGYVSGSQCITDATQVTHYSCPHTNDGSPSSSGTCYHTRTAYTTSFECTSAGYIWVGYCYNIHSADSSTSYVCPPYWTPAYPRCTRAATLTTSYYCPSGGSLSGSTCTTTSSYGASYYSYPGSYYCSGGGTLSNTTCTHVYTGTQGTGYYTCPNGGVATGTTCSYTYELEG